MLRLTVVAGLLLATAAPTGASAESILLQSTTSTEASGLYDHLLARFTAASGIRVDVVAVGTGQAIRNARNCDGDVLLVHDTAAEEAFVAAGYGIARHEFMVNDYVLVGPGVDPAGIAGLGEAPAALARIAAAEAPFASRGDESGTHRKERALWAEAGIDPGDASGGWYRELGSGMGATLNAAVGMQAYALTDRATWAAYAGKADFAILVEGGDGLLNRYGVIAVSPESCPSVNAAGAAAFVDWLLGPAGQAAIAAFRVGGQQVFFPSAAGAP